MTIFNIISLFCFILYYISGFLTLMPFDTKYSLIFKTILSQATIVFFQLNIPHPVIVMEHLNFLLFIQKHLIL